MVEVVSPKPYPIVYDAVEQMIADISGLLPSDIYTQARVNVGNSTCSCGISVLSGLRYSTPEQIVHKILKERHEQDSKKIREAFVMFSDVVGGSGEKLYAHIKNNNIGEITEFGPQRNPNTGNRIKLWIWVPPHEDLSPQNRYMPIYGKIQERDSYGLQSIYRDDPRFARGAREA